MGAQVFMFTQSGETPKQAYERAVARAIERKGKDRYNGTISTTRGVQEFKWEPSDKYPTVESYADFLLEKKVVQKWGSAGCILINPDNKGMNLYLMFGWASC